MIALALVLFVIFGILFLIAGVVAAISLLWFIIKWGLILTGVYLLAKAIVEFLS